jgi:hypothetical protein
MIKINQNTNVEDIAIGQFYQHTKKKKYVYYVKEISNDLQRCIDAKTREEYLDLFLRIDVYNKNMNIVALDVIIPFNKFCSGDIKPYMPSDGYNTCFGDIYYTHYQIEFKIWQKMISMCYNPREKIFPYVGAIGTIVCDKWLCLEFFIADLRHMKGYKEAVEDFKLMDFVVDLYDIQRQVYPANRIYAPGYVQLKEFKRSDVCRYLNEYIHDDRYPKDLIKLTALLQGIMPITELYKKKSGLNFKIDLDNATYNYAYIKEQRKDIEEKRSYNYTSIALNQYREQYSQPNNNEMKEMCIIVTNTKEVKV